MALTEFVRNSRELSHGDPFTVPAASTIAGNRMTAIHHLISFGERLAIFAGIETARFEVLPFEGRDGLVDGCGVSSALKTAFLESSPFCVGNWDVDAAWDRLGGGQERKERG